VLRNLKALGIVEPILKVPQRRMRRSGPMPTIWGLAGHYSNEEVARAVTLHYRTLSPKYRAAERQAPRDQVHGHNAEGQSNEDTIQQP